MFFLAVLSDTSFQTKKFQTTHLPDDRHSKGVRNVCSRTRKLNTAHTPKVQPYNKYARFKLIIVIFY